MYFTQPWDPFKFSYNSVNILLLKTIAQSFCTDKKKKMIRIDR